jgi:Gpi18-like mannosyltransferase
MKKVLFLLPFVFLFAAANIRVAGENLLKNGSFEDISDSLPSVWSTDIYGNDSTSVRFFVENKGAYDGSNYVTVENIRPNDAKLIQTVKVKPNTVYKLSCRIKAEGIGENALGANITVLHILETSKDFKDTGGKWEYVEFYGRTGKKQDNLIITARLGGYGNINTGKASFDDFRLEQEIAPPDAKIANLYKEEDKSRKVEAKLAGTYGHQLVITAVSIFFLGLFFAVYYGSLKRNKIGTIENERINFLFYFFVLVGLILRIIIAPLIEGHPSDISCFKSWANIAASQGLLNFYKTDMFVDYPPGYIYVLYVCGYIKNLFSLDFNSAAFITLLKVPAILSDIIFSIIIFRLGKKPLGAAIASIIAVLYVFNPAVLFNSAIFGQIDSLFALLIFMAIVFAFKDRLIIASVIFAVALSVKPQALIFTPIGIYVLIEKTIQSKSLKTAGLSILSMILTFIVIILPFSTEQNFSWIFNLYGKSLSSYQYGSVNAFNLFAFLGANGVNENNILFLFSYKIWGYISTIVIVISSVFLYFKSRHKSKPFFIAILIMAAFFVLSSRMHERYIFPVFGLALLNYIYTKDKRFLFLFVGFSLTAFLNQALLIDLIFTKQSFWFPSNDLTMRALSLINVALLAYLVKTGIDIHIKNKIQLIAPFHCRTSDTSAEQTETAEKMQNLLTYTESQKIRLSKKDYILLSSLTFIYAVTVLINLGSLKAPQSFWKPANKSESFYADIGKLQDIDRVCYFLGFGAGTYKIDFSEDGQTWQNEKIIEQKSAYEMVEWRYFRLGHNARYIRITAGKPGAMLNEIGFFNPDSTKPIPIKSIVKTCAGLDSPSFGKPENVFDEQNTIAYTPGFFNSMYFDEGYHARTAYESLHKMEPTETTHPPLGKIIISLGIAVFGMTPFGWRIMGTLFGIAMVPLMYLFGMRIFKKTEYAFIAGFLFTFDFMPFSLSRIATIDIFAVFFIVLMYYYMYQYFEMSFFETDLKKTLVPLLLCGIFFGLGLAVKWIALYGGLGLAVVFFTSLGQRFCEYTKARKKPGLKNKIPKKDRQKNESIAGSFPRYTVSTLLWCILVFVFIPAIIYLMSYIPFMKLPGPGHEISNVFSYQKYMYDYHSRLQAVHSFSSNWWEWPIIRKPVWCYTAQYLPANKISSIVMMGNPAIWWAGSLATMATAAIALCKKEKGMYVILIGAVLLYLPWAVAARKLLFIYHFFAAVPFIVLCTTYFFMVMRNKFSKSKYIIYAYLAVVLILFIMFYPVLSGMFVSKSYAAAYLRWFDSWIFFN